MHKRSFAAHAISTPPDNQTSSELHLPVQAGQETNETRKAKHLQLSQMQLLYDEIMYITLTKTSIKIVWEDKALNV